MTTLYSSIIQLRVLRDGCLPQMQGRLALSAFLDIVAQVDPALAQALHDAPSGKPFTVSPLRGLPLPHDGEIHVKAGQAGWLRVTLAGEELFGVFVRRFLYGDTQPTIRLGQVELGVSEVLTSPGSHPWAGYTTIDELLANVQPRDTITLDIASPTSFSLGDNRVEIMPRPELIFGTLRKKWEMWCGQELAQPLSREWLREYVLVSDWRMQSRMLRYGPQAQIGSEGQVTFRLFEAEPEARYLLNVLADFAFYAGVGRKTTQGMGQVRRIVGMKDEG